MEKDKPIEGINDIPSPFESAMEVFKDIDHYKRVLVGITTGLSRKNSKVGNRSNSYLLDGLEVEFVEEILIESLYIDQINSKIILQAPKIAGESEFQQRKRVMFYHSELLKPIEHMRVNGITAIYQALSTEGKNKLSKFECDVEG